MTKNVNSTNLEGQRWTFEKMINGGIGLGNSWTFLPNNRFTEIEWYSGGAYWRHHFSGKYYYEANSKTVFLEYDTDKAPHLKRAIKQQLNLIISENDTILSIGIGWGKTKETSSDIQHNLKIHNTIIGNSTFKIERNINESIENE